MQFVTGGGIWVIKIYFDPELILLFAFNPLYEVNEFDVGIGGVENLKYEKHDYHLGIGISVFSIQYRDIESTGSSFYGHGGVSWIITNTFAIGIDIRKSAEIQSSSNSNSVNSGYFQYTLTLNHQW